MNVTTPASVARSSHRSNQSPLQVVYSKTCFASRSSSLSERGLKVKLNSPVKLLEDETGSQKQVRLTGQSGIQDSIPMPEICKAVFSGATLSEWQAGYRSGRIRPEDLLDIVDSGSEDPAWITPLDEDRLCSQAAELAALLEHAGGDFARLPLYGVPFAVKDNIDVAGWPTTAACPEFAYVPQSDATVVRRLREAGAIVVGKTNLDQFATGLVGTRSPYGTVPNSFRPEYICGGSSSGSASVVARGFVPFALGTDTAGSGRSPPASTISSV